MAGARSSGDERSSMTANRCGHAFHAGAFRKDLLLKSFSSRLKGEGSITTKRAVLSSLVPISGDDGGDSPKKSPPPFKWATWQKGFRQAEPASSYGSREDWAGANGVGRPSGSWGGARQNDPHGCAIPADGSLSSGEKNLIRFVKRRRRLGFSRCPTVGPRHADRLCLSSSGRNPW